MNIVIYTDGGCAGNPGPGAWSFVIDLPDGPVERAGYNPNTTNNRMELQAVIEALLYVAEAFPGQDYVLNTDSQYVKKGISEWIIRWKRNNWKTSSKKAVKNQDLWRMLDRLNEELRPGWNWVRGHDGIELNERCDFLVQKCIKNEGR